jgi:hypothetical protein
MIWDVCSRIEVQARDTVTNRTLRIDFTVK